MLRKAIAFARIAARQRIHDRAAVVGRMGFFALILFIFTRLWTVVLEGDPIDGASVDNFVWYLAITEWIVLSVPLVHVDIEQDVRNGDLVYRLTRPLPYPIAKLAEGVGDLLVRMVALGVFGVALAFAYTGTVPLSPLQAALTVGLGVSAGALTLVFYTTLGLCAFWVHDTRPFYWMWQKAAFVLGGLIVPLQLYPAWLRRVADLSPFSALLNGPGRMALGGSLSDAGWVVVKLSVWTVVAGLLLGAVYRRAVRAVAVGGG